MLDADIKACFDEIDHDALMAPGRAPGGRPADVEAAAELGCERGCSRAGWSPTRSQEPRKVHRFPRCWPTSPSTSSTRRGRRRPALGTLVRYCDDFVVLTPSGSRAEEAQRRIGGGTGRTRAALASRQDPDRVPRRWQGRLRLSWASIIGRPSRSGGARRYLSKWPSPRAMASIRAKVRDRTDRRFAGRELRRRCRRPQPRAAGLGGVLPLRKLESASSPPSTATCTCGCPSWPASSTPSGTSTGPPGSTTDWLTESRHLSAHRNGPLLDCACLTMNDVGEPCAGEPHARFDRGPLGR